MPLAELLLLLLLFCNCVDVLAAWLSVNADMTHRGSIERRKKKGQVKGNKPRLDPWRRDHGSLWDTLSPLLSLSLNPLFSLSNSLSCGYYDSAP
ncbi:MAG: hypothetical protein JOS17DRAFT_753681 [Linnemannia elongata]|nr:MAG: hypothetical protein JOS17DRAFT_753681 [Linnemannia elongata]